MDRVDIGRIEQAVARLKDVEEDFLCGYCKYGDPTI